MSEMKLIAVVCLQEEESTLAIGGSRRRMNERMDVIRVDVEYLELLVLGDKVEWERVDIKPRERSELATCVVMSPIDV